MKTVFSYKRYNNLSHIIKIQLLYWDKLSRDLLILLNIIEDFLLNIEPQRYINLGLCKVRDILGRKDYLS